MEQFNQLLKELQEANCEPLQLSIAIEQNGVINFYSFLSNEYDEAILINFAGLNITKATLEEICQLSKGDIIINQYRYLYIISENKVNLSKLNDVSFVRYQRGLLDKSLTLYMTHF